MRHTRHGKEPQETEDRQKRTLNKTLSQDQSQKKMTGKRMRGKKQKGKKHATKELCGRRKSREAGKGKGTEAEEEII